MHLAPLRTLLAIRETGSFSAAAQAVNLSHSTVSVQMKQLEARLGVSLFVPGKRPAQLTPMGIAACRHAETVLHAAQELTTLGAGDETGGSVTLGLVPTCLQHLLPVVLSALRGEFPALSLRVTSGLSTDLVAGVRAREIDFAVITDRQVQEPGLAVTTLAHEPLILIAPPGIKPPPRPLALFARHPYVAFSSDTWLGAQIARALGDAGVGARPDFELDSIDAVENLVSKGFGISVVPQRLFSPDMSRRMTCLPFAESRFSRALGLASHPDAHRFTIRQRLVKLIREAQ